MGLCKSTDFSVYFWFSRSVVLIVFRILCFLDFEKCKFLCFFKLAEASKVFVDIFWKCIVKISIQHYCVTVLVEYCSNNVQSVLCWMGLCKSTDCSVYFWFPRSVVLIVFRILCFLDFEKCKNFVFFEVLKSSLTSPGNVL